MSISDLSFFSKSKALHAFCNDHHIRSLGLFGSYVRGEANANSDVDVLVEFQKPVTYFELLETEDHLSQYLGKKVDLLTPDALNPRIRPNVEKDLQMFYERA